MEKAMLARGLVLLFCASTTVAACGGSQTFSEVNNSPTPAPTMERTTGEPFQSEPPEQEEETTTNPVDSSEERIASDVGITSDSIKIAVVIPDLKGLRDVGFPLPAALSNQHLVERFSSYFNDWNAAGGINGRMIEPVEISWNPLSTSSMEESCIKATLDEQVFMAVNGPGFSPEFIPCFTQDSDTLFLYGEVASQALIDLTPDRLFTLNPPAEVAGVVGVELAIEQAIITPDERIGILTMSDVSMQAASSTAERILETAGYETTTITVDGGSGDNAASNAESAAAVAQFTAEGVDHVFVMIPFIYASGFWGEVGAVQPEWGRTLIDSAPSNCTPFGASRTNPAAEGALCVTSYDSYARPEGGLRDDNEFQLTCRQEWLNHFPVFNGQSDVGVPSGEVGLETFDGEFLNSDYAPWECTMVRFIKEALEGAGINPTRDSFANALRKVSGPMAFRSNGQGAFGPSKNYYSTQMWVVRFTIVSPNTPRGEDGTFNGCPAPVNCWIPVTGEWFAID